MNIYKWLINLFKSSDLVNARLQIKDLEQKLAAQQAEITSLQDVAAEYQEMLVAGWDYPERTVRLPKSRDIIPRTDIKREAQGDGKYRLVINNIPNFWIADIADTLSEDPFFGYGHNLVLVHLPQPEAPYRYEDLAVGDTAVYKLGERFISHQIVKIEVDAQGRKYTFRGRNNVTEDPYDIRNSDIKCLLVNTTF